ncbi:MAG: PBP1A family penicillin-binding protein [Candidatus Levybacteria bacterium]|nr:PBP1A family penicillin-binding protein [Candidatus Levybacteria bacterium]
MVERVRQFFLTFFHHPKKRMELIKKLSKELWLIGKKPLLLLLLGLFILLLLTPVATYFYFIRDLGSKERIMNRNNEGVVLLDRTDKPFFTFYEAKTNNTIPFGEIPQSVKNAVVSVEDKDFYRHAGISPTSVIRAALADIRNQEITQGGSTITQQLIKNALLSPEKTFLRKYQEAVLALEVDRRYSKNDILEMYLNTVYFGEGAFGIEDAAKAYFGKSASELTLGESALLCGILPAPSALSPISGDAEAAFRRQQRVLGQMVDQGYISAEEADAAKEEEIALNPQGKELNVKAPHFALMVKDELVKKYGEQRVARSGFIVKTTLDLTNQEYTEQVVKNQVARLRVNKATNGAVVVMDPKTGEILSLVGSHDWFDEENGKINMTIRPRQPGSSFKPIMYADGLRRRLITPATVLDDKPITFKGGYKPKNYDGKFRDHVLVRYALANSLNIPSLHVMERVGVKNGVEFARRLGLTTLDPDQDYGLALVLGAGEVSLLQMTDAFGVFASQGYLVTPTTIIEVRDKNKHVIFTNKPKKEFVLDQGVAFLISSILSDNEARKDTFGNALTISRPAAVKTGTTEDYRDALTIGYTPNLVVGVWVGNNDNTPMDSVAGSLGAAPIWRLVMQKFFQTLPNEPFAKPITVIRQEVCKEDGKKAEAATSSAYPEFFLSGTVPKDVCFEGTPTGEPTPSDEPTPTNTTEPTQTPQPEQPTPTNALPTTTAMPTPTEFIALPTLTPLPTL